MNLLSNSAAQVFWVCNSAKANCRSTRARTHTDSWIIPFENSLPAWQGLFGYIMLNLLLKRIISSCWATRIEWGDFFNPWMNLEHEGSHPLSILTPCCQVSPLTQWWLTHRLSRTPVIIAASFQFLWAAVLFCFSSWLFLAQEQPPFCSARTELDICNTEACCINPISSTIRMLPKEYTVVRFSWFSTNL